MIDLCGLGEWQAGNFDGISLAPLIEQHDSPTWPDRALVTDSQRLTMPVKWRKSAVMTDRRRLINGRELYDMTVDRGQRNDIAADHPDMVGELRGAYEAWWTKVSRQFDEEIPITVGDPESASIMLSSHDWRNENCECVWNQSQVRAGLVYNGYWELDVAIAGHYRFELRRWPREEDRALTGGIAGKVADYGTMSLESGYGGGVALPISTAHIAVGGHEQEQTVAADAKYAEFSLDLPAGPTHLQTYFGLDNDAGLGAYYVYIERLISRTAPLDSAPGRTPTGRAI